MANITAGYTREDNSRVGLPLFDYCNCNGKFKDKNENGKVCNLIFCNSLKENGYNELANLIINKYNSRGYGYYCYFADDVYLDLKYGMIEFDGRGNLRIFDRRHYFRS